MLKATGIVRRMDDLGRIVIPKELRKAYELKEGTKMEIYTDEQGIVLRRYMVESSLLKRIEGIGEDIREENIDTDTAERMLEKLREVQGMLEKLK